MSLLHKATPCAAAPAHTLRDRIKGARLPFLTIPAGPGQAVTCQVLAGTLCLHLRN